MGQRTGIARSQQKKATREQILAAATKLLAEHGYAALRVAAVAKEAGVSLGGQLHHFPSKESLVVAVLERLSREVTDLARRDADRDNAEADILLLIARSAERYYATPEFLIFLDIFLSVRRHTIVGNAAIELALRERAAVERLWCPHLTERGIEKDKAVAIVRALWGLARGLAISSSGERDKSNSATMSLVLNALRASIFGEADRTAG